jgi:hypothetical protein
MKGVIEIEFIISVFVFITSISFVTIIIVGNIPTVHNAAISENIKSTAYQYSEMLLIDEGAPADWNTFPFSEAKRVGFSTGIRYLLDIGKITQLSDLCRDPDVGYNIAKNRLGVDFAHDIVIEVSALDGSPVAGGDVIICRPLSTSSLRQRFSVARLGVLNDASKSIVRLRVTILS